MTTRLFLVAALLLVAGCSGESDSGSEARPCPSAIPIERIHGLPADIGLRLSRVGTITKVVERRGAVGAETISELSVVELYPILARALLDAGYQIVSGDNEGFEAEIFFARGKLTGVYRLREGPCPGLVTIKVLYGTFRRVGSNR